MTHAIGIDVGGTKIAAGLVDLTRGVIDERRSIPTLPERGGAAVLADVLALARALHDAARAPVVAIGLGVCELVGPAGEITSDFTIAWRGTDVRGALAGIAPAAVDADVRAHALAEAVFGAGRGHDTFVFASVGTGISSCLVQQGVPYAGARGNALVLATGPVTVMDAHGRRVQILCSRNTPAAARWRAALAWRAPSRL